MSGRTTKVGTLAAAAVVALAFSSVLVHASPRATDSDDHYKPAGTQITGTSHKTIFSVPPSGGLTVTCTNSSSGGKTPATGIGRFAISPLPSFNDGVGKPCTDNLNGKDTTTTSGPWTIGMIDKANDETSAEPNTDQLSVVVPKGGAVVKTSEGCTIVVAPSAPYTVTGSYSDSTGTFTVNLTGSFSSLPVKVSGGGLCPVTPPNSTCSGQSPALCSSFAGTYVFSPKVSDAS